MCEGFICRRHAILFRVAATTPFFFRGPAISFRFISEVAPRNPGHATHFTKGNENPLGNKLGGGPSGGAHEPPPASINASKTQKTRIAIRLPQRRTR